MFIFSRFFQDMKTSDPATWAFNKNINIVKEWSNNNSPLPFENKIQVTELLQQRGDLFFGPSGYWMNFDLLMGSHELNDHNQKKINYDEEIRKIDEVIEDEKKFEAEILACPY